MPPNFG